MAEDETITDLEAFHRELQSSYGQLEQLVASWNPSNAPSTLPSTRDDNVAIPRGRPERLGLGASLAKSAYAANSRVDSAETKKLKQLMGAESKKRRRSEEPESKPAPVANAGPSTSAPSDDDEDSRAKAFSSKKAKSAGPVFHDKPANKSAKKAKAVNGEAFAVPAVPTKAAESKKSAERSRSSTPQTATPSAGPSRSPSRPANIRPPYALPSANAENYDAGEEEEATQDDDEDMESVTTDATQSTVLGTPLGSPNGKPKRKRKKKKKKKPVPTATEAGGGTSVPSLGDSGNLFGTSTVS